MLVLPLFLPFLWLFQSWLLGGWASEDRCLWSWSTGQPGRKDKWDQEDRLKTWILACKGGNLGFCSWRKKTIGTGTGTGTLFLPRQYHLTVILLAPCIFPFWPQWVSIKGWRLLWAMPSSWPGDYSILLEIRSRTWVSCSLGMCHNCYALGLNGAKP